MKTGLVWAAAFGLAAAGCGSDAKCGDGTFKDGSKCVGYDPSDDTDPVTTVDPAGGRSRDPLPSYATLTANEPAEIFWTTDGSDPSDADGELSPVIVPDLVDGMTLRLFARDLAGNKEEERSITFIHDPVPPAGVTLALALTGSDAEVSWTNPTDADFAGTLVARVTGPLDAYPVPGTLYTAPAVLSSNVEIVSSGPTATSFDDPSLAPGFARYVAWTYDDLGNYSQTASAHSDVSLGSLAGTVMVTSTAVTPTVQPTHLVLSGTSSWLAGTLTLNLTIENVTNKYFQNPKLSVTAAAPGTFSNADGTIEGTGFKYYGPNHLAPGGITTRTLTFTGVLVTDTVVVSVALLEHPSLVGGSRARTATTRVFLSDARVGNTLATTTLALVDGPNNNRGSARGFCASPDGRYGFVGNQHFGAVTRIDLSTRTLAGTRQEEIPSWASEVVCHGGDLYAVLNGGGLHRNAGNAVAFGVHEKLAIVRFNEALQERDRLVISNVAKSQGMGHATLSPDGATLAIAAGLEIVLVDTRTMTQILPGGSSLVPGFVDEGGVSRVAWATTANTLFAVGRQNGDFARYDFPQTLSDAPVLDRIDIGGKTGGLAVGPDGRVWIGNQSNQLLVYDPFTRVLSSTPYGLGVRDVAFIDGELRVLRGDQTTIDVVDSTGTIVPGRTISMGSSLYQHWLSSTDR